MSRYEELRALADAATPGPWRWDERWDWTDRTEGSLLTEAPGQGLYRDSPLVMEPTGSETEAIQLKTADAAYLTAASPDVILALLDRLDELEAGHGQPAERTAAGRCICGFQPDSPESAVGHRLSAAGWAEL